VGGVSDADGGRQFTGYREAALNRERQSRQLSLYAILISDADKHSNERQTDCGWLRYRRVHSVRPVVTALMPFGPMVTSLA
jgi:hypothetical protein